MCEDFPACGHELGCCPDFDEDGTQLNMRCVCGAVLSVNSRYSLCATCLRRPEDGEDWGDDEEPEDDFDDSMDGDHESGLASAGWGTDESYGYFGGDSDE